MAQPKEKLDDMFRSLFGEAKPNVYYSPPDGLQIKYPCILYELSNTDVQFADNGPFITYNRYVVTVIDRDPDSKLRDEILYFPRCSFDRAFKSDNLNHFVFTIYF